MENLIEKSKLHGGHYCLALVGDHLRFNSACPSEDTG